ncbi:MAG: GNAT family N-acetyltransferase [Nocardioides sp.]
MDARLRRPVASDAGEVAAVYVTSWNTGFRGLMPPKAHGAYQVARWERELTGGSVRWWVALHGESIVGFVGTGPSRDPLDANLGEVDTIAVAPGTWRQGLGRVLMAAALDDLRSAGYAAAILWTLAESEPAHAFYTATGWRASGESRDGGSQVAFRHLLSQR